MKRYILILIIFLIRINLYSNGLISLSGYVKFKETQEKTGNISLKIISKDLLLDTTIATNRSGFYKVLLPENQYTVMINNDSLIGISTINLKEPTTKDFIAYYNFLNDYKVFRNGFQRIFTSKNSETIGLKSNGEFRRTVFVGVYAAYSFTENGVYEERGDTIITKIQSVDCYTNMNVDLIGHIDYYVKSSNSNAYLIDKTNNKYELINFRELETIYKSN